MELSGLYVREGKAISKAKGALVIAEAIPGTKYNEIVDVVLSNGEVKTGQAIDISEEATVIQVFGCKGIYEKRYSQTSYTRRDNARRQKQER